MVLTPRKLLYATSNLENVLRILVDSSEELPDQKKNTLNSVGFLSISTSRVTVFFCQLVWLNSIQF